jgi:hypothetical protein
VDYLSTLGNLISEIVLESNSLLAQDNHEIHGAQKIWFWDSAQLN